MYLSIYLDNVSESRMDKRVRRVDPNPNPLFSQWLQQFRVSWLDIKIFSYYSIKFG